MKEFRKSRFHGRKIFAAIFCLFAAVFLLVALAFLPNLQSGLIAKAEETPYSYGDDVMVVEQYDVQAEVRSDRTVVFKERLTVYFTENLSSRATTFYRSLPVDGGDRYFDAWAKCEEVKGFSWNVADNPDLDGFIDINCVGGVKPNTRRTYELGYTLLPASKKGADGMYLNVVGAGVMVPIRNVSVSVTFPGECTFVDVHSNKWGEKGNVYVDEWALSTDKKRVTMRADLLPVLYNETYQEKVAAGITLEFNCKGMQSYSSTRVTSTIWVTGIGCFAAAGLAVLITVFCRKKKEIIKVVGVKPPRGMDPLKMGKLIDGKVDGEDITSMLYYFAAQGYLKIDFSDEEDPVLIRTEKPFPEDMPSYQLALLRGLTKWGNTVKISQLKHNFYTESDKANQLLSAKEIRRHEWRSLIGFVGCLLLAWAVCDFVPWLIGRITLGGGYNFFGGPAFLGALIVCGFLFKFREDRRYKNKRKKTLGWTVAAAVILAGMALIYVFLMPVHVLSRIEKIILYTTTALLPFVGARVISLTDEYAQILGEILGFKDFIVYAEEDKLKAMLEENPELYYDILPYAQVLGVTDQWEGKFKNILLRPPTWAQTSGEFTVFDYLLLRRCMRLATVTMLSRPQAQGGGTRIGGSGSSGGSFGGFSGGGSGGGGFGVR